MYKKKSVPVLGKGMGNKKGKLGNTINILRKKN